MTRPGSGTDDKAGHGKHDLALDSTGVISMTVTADYSPLAEMAEEELVSAFISRDGDEERGGIEHPLMLAALMQRRRRDRGDGIFDNPMLLAALMRHRRGEDDAPPIDPPTLPAPLMHRRRRDRGDGIFDNPLLLAALMRRRRGEDDEH